MITKEDILQMANLSRLSVKDEELEDLTKAMSDIIEFADTINNATVEGEEFDNINNLSNVFRKDEVVQSYGSKEILQNAIDTEDNCFLVKKRVL